MPSHVLSYRPRKKHGERLAELRASVQLKEKVLMMMRMNPSEPSYKLRSQENFVYFAKLELAKYYRSNKSYANHPIISAS